ncbi:MAG: hypothetical protein L3J72_04795 [Thermoplasmata archaeon]|nr:hypothetical protein [Thermoplasmata archaeon]
MADQRNICGSGDFWDVRLETQQILFETDSIAADGGDRDAQSQGCTNLVDGNVHHLILQRSGGQMTTYVDGTIDASPTGSAAAFGSLPTLVIGNDACVGIDGTVAFDATQGTISNVCFTAAAVTIPDAGYSACNPPTSSSSSSGSSSSSSSSSGSSGSSSASSSSSSSSSGSAATVTYTADVLPIFAHYCAPCHTVQDDGQSDFAFSYSDSQAAANPTVSPACTASQTVGACSLTDIQIGNMPLGAGCTGNPTTDSGNAACLTAAEQATLEAWISDGQQQ